MFVLEVSPMSKRKENQFLCSSMMLPEHREELSRRYGEEEEEEEEKRIFLRGEQSREEVARHLTQSLLQRLPVEIQVGTGRDAAFLQGMVVESRRQGFVRLRTEKGFEDINLEGVTGCTLLKGAPSPGPPEE